MGGVCCAVDSKDSNNSLEPPQGRSNDRNTVNYVAQIKGRKDLMNQPNTEHEDTTYFGTLLEEFKEGSVIKDDYKNQYEVMADEEQDKEWLLRMYEEMSDRDSGKWMDKVKEDNIKVSFQMKGTSYSKDFQVVYSEMMFEPGTDMDRLISAVHNFQFRSLWDPDLEEGEVVETTPDKNMIIWYQVNKSSIKYVQKRNILEKKLFFTDDEGRIYVFYSSVPDSFKEEEEGQTRATTLIGFQRFEKLEDASIKMVSFGQTDVKLKGAALMGFKGLAPSVIPKALQEWHKRLTEYMQN